MRIAPAAAALVFTISQSCLKAADAAAPDQFATDFYRSLLAQKPFGIPSPAKWRVLRPFFSDDLAEAVVKAQKTEAEHTRKRADEPPVFGDGCLFSSLYEGPTKFTVGKPVPKKDATRVPVALAYTSGKEKTEWTDTLVLIPDGKSWRIRDIEFGGKWTFKSGQSLRKVFGVK